jgi:hypothetical protein
VRELRRLAGALRARGESAVRGGGGAFLAVRLTGSSFLYPVVAGLAAAALVAFVVHVIGAVSLRDTSLNIVPVRQDGGHAAVADIRVLGLTSGMPRASRFRLFEDGREVGPDAALHDDVRTKGHGRYSVWGEWLVYSAADGTTAATNGRRYELRGPAPVPTWLPPALFLVLLIAGRLHRIEQWRWLARFAVRPASALSFGLVGWGLIGVSVNSTMRPFDIAKREGHAYAWRVPNPSPGLTRIVSDGAANPEASSLLLIESGQEIGPPHTPHLYVGARGHGHFSHWGEDLVFSTSDNSDPRSNGLSYRAEFRVYPAPWLLISAAVFAVIATGLWWRRTLTVVAEDRRDGLVARAYLVACCVVALAAIAATASRFDLIAGTVRVYKASMEPAHPIKLRARMAILPLWAAPFVSWATCDGKGARVVDVPTSNICPDASNLEVAKLNQKFESNIATAAIIYGSYVIISEIDWGKAPGHYKLQLPLRVDVEACALLSAAFLILGILTIARLRTAGRVTPRFPSTRASPRTRHGHFAVLLFASGALIALSNLGVHVYHLRGKELRPNLALANYGPSDFTLGIDDARKAIKRLPGEADEAYAHRITLVVADAISHVWWPSLSDRFRLRVPIWENYLLWAKGGLVANQTPYIFIDPDKALKRGVGHCGQVAVLLAGLLHRAGIKASIALLDGHGLVSAEVRPGVHHLLDPDFAVVLPFNIETAQTDLIGVRRAYQVGLERMRVTDRPGLEPYVPSIEDWLDKIEVIYRRPGGRLATIKEYLGEDHVRFERLAYRLRWPLPIVLLLLGGGLLLLHRLRRRRIAQFHANR